MIEREYAAKMLALANRAAERKNRKIAALVLGDEPTKSWGDDVLKQRHAFSPLLQWVQIYTFS